MIFLLSILISLGFAKSPTLTSSLKTVTTAGTEERLASTSTKYHMLILQAECDNTGYVYIGGSTVASTNGIRLSACESFTFSGSTFQGTNTTFDLYEIWVDVSVNGDGVKILGITRQ